MEFSWPSALVIVVLSCGNAALLIGAINRLYSLPWPDRVLHRLRQIHDLLMVGLPIAFVWCIGVRGPRLLLGGSWNDLPWPLTGYLFACGFAAAVIPAVAWRRRQAHPPELQLSNHSLLVDVAARLGYRPIGAGPHRLMTRFPANEFLHVEISDKEYRLPNLPSEWDGFSILHISDLHFIGTVDRPYFEELVKMACTLPAEVVCFTGDLLDREDLISWLPETLGRFSAPLGCWYVLGNHDWYVQNTDAIRRELGRLGWRGLAGRCEVVEYAGRSLAMCGSERPWMGRHPNLDGVPSNAFRLMLSHTPDNLPWARRHGIDLMLAGHTHGGQVRLPGIGPVYAPSAFGTKYTGGAFWEDPTLMYVSRGVGGREPWRWNCPPELTRLILRTAR